ncbi:hypothetical protein STRCI_001307 [Streptomyces cinnabarinus]|uniref:Uncharacterized protein n=1 Tax=Streptomyces cinnabarinus TaxID=67287 RepID=A0ABY7K6R3_9ACTN|nr:hypothetical protein [Streptomyces cinnabarinus]WAZ20206.1 hypothetical protein STRCI_001307 [Streptomyces cinnabarinus]
MNRRITVAEYLVRRGLPADWRFGSWLGRVAAEIYRDTYRREPRRAFRFINGRFRRVMAYTPGERHVLSEAWEAYGRYAVDRPAPAARPRPVAVPRLTSGDAMRWIPTNAPVRSHP